jgi:serine phosphatase RsbU (regulator of sigma subunit)
LTWRDGALFVCRLPRGRNPIYFRGQDQGFAEFRVAAGDPPIVIGQTAFIVQESAPTPEMDRAEETLRGGANDLAIPQEELTYSPQELRQVKYINVDERIEALASLPEVIRFSPSDAELESRVVDVLLRGISRGTAAAVVRLKPAGAGDTPPVEVGTTAGRDGPPEQLQPSRRLVFDAFRRRQSVCYRWDVRDGGLEFTAHEGFDWAICTPLPGDATPGWGLYVAGRLRGGLQSKGPSYQDLLKSDLKFAEAVAEIFGALRQVRELQAEKILMLTSQRIAQEIQAGFFPRTLPEVRGYELAAYSRSAEATGGDYYDVIQLPSGRVGLTVADVSGHGLGPSLLMASVRATLRGLAFREPAPECLLSDLNHAMFDDLRPRHRFITLLYGVLAPADHQFLYANAGHGPVTLHLPAGQHRFRSLADDESRGCPIGILKERYQACAPVPLAPGDLLILGSDGIVETRRGPETFGMQRLEDYILKRRDCPLEQLLEELLEATTTFQEGNRPGDDLTLMLVRRT